MMPFLSNLVFNIQILIKTIQVMYVQHNIESRSGNHCCSRKRMSITYSECVFVASVIQHAKRVSLIMLWSVACPAVPYFFRICQKRYDFREKKFLNIKCVL